MFDEPELKSDWKKRKGKNQFSEQSYSYLKWLRFFHACVRYDNRKKATQSPTTNNDQSR